MSLAAGVPLKPLILGLLYTGSCSSALGAAIIVLVGLIEPFLQLRRRALRPAPPAQWCVGIAFEGAYTCKSYFWNVSAGLARWATSSRSDGYARNFLLPKGKALRATKANLAPFETQRSQLEATNLELKKEADAVAAKLNGKSFIALRQASDSGQLYGSVSTRDIAERSPKAASPSRVRRSCSTGRSRRWAGIRCESACIRK